MNISTTVLEQININEAERIKETIIALLMLDLKKPGSSSSKKPTILRAEIRVEGLDAMPWLCAQRPASRGYWSDREGCFELAGVGRADSITGNCSLGYHELMTILNDRIAAANGNARYFGGLSFSKDGAKEQLWDYFKAYLFILPRFEVLNRNGTTTFACNMLTDEDIETIRAELSLLVFPETKSPSRLPTPIKRRDYPDFKTWQTNIRTVLASFEPGKYEKVVLARKATFELSDPIDAACLLGALKEKTHRCFHFLFQPDSSAAFLGASPERLYRRDGHTLKTEAIAGSRPRGDSTEADEALCLELISSEKDLREHNYVVRDIRNSLTDLCSLLVEAESPSVLKLARCQHLITTFKAKLRSGVKDADLLETLHPTPAVGGFPTRRALRDISRLEPFDRGWYAAPVGWIGKDAAQFAVGIRSGLCEGSRLHLFSGAGIVDGSTPDEEWEEIENKISDFVSLLTRS